MDRINQYWEKRRIAESSVYTFQNYFNTVISINGFTPIVPKTVQISMMKYFQNNDKSNAITHRQAGGTTALISYALWETFFIKPRQVNVFVCHSESAARDVRSKIYDQLQFSATTFEKVGIDISEIRQDGNGGFRSPDVNTLRVIALDSLSSKTRGIAVSSIYFDNAIPNSQTKLEQTLQQLKFMSSIGTTKIHQLQSGLYSTVTHIESDPSTKLFPMYMDVNYSIDTETDLINRLGTNKFCTEYLLMRK